ncbi:HAMP domain-containing sensor histidine kinase [Nonomuraea sp. NPDC002799]
MTQFTAATVALLSTLLVATVMIAIHRYATDNLLTELAATGGRVAHQVEHHRPSTPLAAHPDRNVQIVDAHRTVIASTPHLHGKPAMAAFTPAGVTITGHVVCGGVFPAGDCHHVIAQSAYHDGQDWVVYSSSPTIPPYVTPWLAATVIATAILLAAAITALGHRIVTASLRPVTAIRAELDQITDTTGDRRVSLPPGQDEIHDLADSVNRTLTRLQAAMRQQRHFTSDASHELATPIAAIRAEVEDALYAPQDTTVPRLGTTVLRSVNRLETILKDLLTIAQLEAGRPLDSEPIDLAQFVTAQVRQRPAPAHQHLLQDLQPGVTVIGDRAKLARLYNNLMDNAERHAATTISIDVRHEPAPPRDTHRFPHGIAVLQISDDGPGIDPDKREQVFQRFSRLDTARNRDTGGTGLGLPIARQIAQAHGGTLHIADSPQGARALVRLPAADAQHPQAPATSR